MANVTGTDDPELLSGTPDPDVVDALDGDDEIEASAGADTVDGGPGTDTLSVSFPSLIGIPDGPHSYVITATHLGDGSGTIDTTFTSIEHIDICECDATDDVTIDASGFGGTVTVSAGAGDDTLTGTDNDDDFSLYEGGHDLVDGGLGTDTLFVSLIGPGEVATVVDIPGGFVLTQTIDQVTAYGIERLTLASDNGPLLVDASGSSAEIDFYTTSDVDEITGSTGDNVFYGDLDGFGDLYSGGGGSDLFLFSGYSALGAEISDLDADDRIDLSAVGVTFIGSAAFSGTAGEARYFNFGGQTIVDVDSDGDGIGDTGVVIGNGRFILDETAPGSNVLLITGNAADVDPGDNVIDGTGADDLLEGGAGDDVLSGLGGDDRISGDDNNDTLDGGDDDDDIEGGNGDDIITGGAGSDAMYGDDGNDTLTDSGDDDNVFEGGDGNDTLTMTGVGPDPLGVTFMAGGQGDDVIIGSDSMFLIFGDEDQDGFGGGDDTITVTGATDGSLIAAGHGNDIVSVQADAAVLIVGGGGGDEITLEGDMSGGFVYTDQGYGPAQAPLFYGNNLVHLLSGTFDITLDGLQDRVDIQSGGLIQVTIDDFNAGEEGDVLDLSYYGMDPFGSGRLTIAQSVCGCDTEITDTVTGSIFVLLGVDANELSAFNLGVDNPLYAPGSGLQFDFDPFGPDFDYRWVGQDSPDDLTGFDGDDILLGAGGDDVIEGGLGNDFLKGGTGVDFMRGGAGDDDYSVDDTGDLVVEYAGHGVDTVTTSLGDYALGANVENLLYGGTGSFTGTGNGVANIIDASDASEAELSGDAGNDTLIGGIGNDLLDGGAGRDTMTGGEGDDIYVVDHPLDTIVELSGEGYDVVNTALGAFTLGANLEQLDYTGTGSFAGTGNGDGNTIRADGASAATLAGMGGEDTLIGGTGNDLLDGGTGADAMSGGDGDDTYVVDDGNDGVNEADGEGTDTVRSSISYALVDYVENLTLLGGASTSATGNELANLLIGNGGHNTLDGGLGADRMEGGQGDDTYIVDDSGDTIVEATGYDRLLASVSYTLADGVAVELMATTDAAGTDAIDLTGNDLVNRIIGNAGNNVLTGAGNNDRIEGLGGDDWLIGSAGADLMIGGTGSDTYVVGDAGDVVAELAGQGTDTVETALASYTLGLNVEDLLYTGSGSFAGTGNNDNNMITGGGLGDTLNGSAGNDILYGMGGIDTLNGGAGNDTLDGGAGADAMNGGAGDDLYLVDDASDLVTELANQGTDTVRTAIGSYSIGNHVENLIYTGTGVFLGSGGTNANTIDATAASEAGLYGLGGNDVLLGGAGNDGLDGGTGRDTMEGGMGNDAYTVDHLGDIVIEAAGAGTGTDLVYTAMAAYTLGTNLENLSYIGTGAFAGTGNALNNWFVAFDSTAATFKGMGGADLIMGGAGNDTLDGGTGSDDMRGDLGDDVYFVDETGDTVTELSSAGTDTVRSTISYTLGANVENLALIGGGAVNATGNGLANILTGNGAANILDGGVGADEMYGGGGDDIFIVDDSADVTYDSGGFDTVKASLNYGLALGVAIEVLRTTDDTGTADLSLVGNEFANRVIGNAGSNDLNGGAGADRLEGLDGNDRLDGGNDADLLIGGSGADSFAFASTLGAGNVDRLADFLHGTDSIELDGSIFGAIGTGTLAASAFGTGTAATTAAQRIVYDKATGNLFYDADGSGGGAAVLFAVLQNKPADLAASDFTVTGSGFSFAMVPVSDWLAMAPELDAPQVNWKLALEGEGGLGLI